MSESVNPQQCVLALAVPLSEEQFHEDLDCPTKDYVKSMARHYVGAAADYLWETYRPSVDLLERVGREVRSLGASVERRVGLPQFHGLLTRYRVVTLVAHFSNGQIELVDGLHSAQQFVQAVSVDFDGVLDLSVCNSASLGEAIKQRSRRATVIRTSDQATPRFKLTRYKYIMRELARREQPYLDALFSVHNAALEALYS